MATAREHMAADLAFVLADTGEGSDVVSIDIGDGNGAQDVNCFLDRLDFEPADFEGGLVERMQVTALPGSMGEPVVDQEIMVNGNRVRVISVDATEDYLDFIYERYSS